MAGHAQKPQQVNIYRKPFLFTSHLLITALQLPNEAITTPKAARRNNGPKTTPKPTPTANKENIDPKAKSKTTTSAKADKDANKGDWRDIVLDEIRGEILCYDNAATVRRKLKKLLTDKSIIPGTSKKWTQASMTAEMQELERRGHPVEYNKNAIGPSVRSLGNFLKKSGQMGAGDSPCYYWGYVMLEKLRIWKGKKKSKTRLEAEEK